MKFAQFIVADDETQLSSIAAAQYVAEIKNNGAVKKLGILHDFYIEKVFDAGAVLIEVNAFEHHSPLLEPYLEQIDISERII